LRFYAQQFNTVEVDSTYYALPAEPNARLWTERTPDGFVFNIKPFALMTQHPAEVSRLPKQLREMLPAEKRNNRLWLLKTPKARKPLEFWKTAP